MLDKRSTEILRHLAYTPATDSRQLMKEFELSRNQLNYSIQKINKWAAEQNYPLITRSREGEFIVPREIRSGVINDRVNKKVGGDEATLTEHQRLDLMFLMIMMNDSYLSLDHFVLEMNISKNTALRSLNQLRQTLPENIQINYSRYSGYEFVGKEWEIRKYAIRIIDNVRNMENGKKLLESYIGVCREEIDYYHEILENAEEMLNVHFTDDRSENLPYILALVEKRILQGHLIQESFDIHNDMLADTQEYSVASELFKNWRQFPDQEKLFVTLQLLTTNVFSGQLLTEKLAQQLAKVTDECLELFEKIALVELPDKEYLKRRLLLHLKPAYYRIKYRLNLKMNVEDFHLSDEQEAMKFLVYESFQPLVEFIGEEIPDEEFEFIAIFVLSALTEVNQPQVRKKAIVVCKSGVLISQTLDTFLQKIFPEFEFLQPCSLRAFLKKKLSVDVVFSTVPIPDQQNVYLVKPLMEKFELEALRIQVFNDMSNDTDFQGMGVTVESILEIVQKHAMITDEHRLKEELLQLVYRMDPDDNSGAAAKNLLDILAPADIQIVDRVSDYAEAIRIASQPLFESKKVVSEYIEKMISNHDYDDPYTLLGEQVAIPHAMPEFGVKQLGISLLFVREGVPFSEDSRIYFIFIFAPIDKEEHITALFEVMNIAEDQELLEQMRTVPNEMALYALLKERK